MDNPITSALADFTAGLAFDHIPSKVIDHLKICMLDTFGCGLFGSTLPWSSILMDTINDFEHNEGQKVTIWGTPYKMSAPNAALINGTMVHGFELDDLHKRSIVHPGSVATTAAFAAAEHKGKVNGPELLTAVVAGYEVGARVGMCMGVSHLRQGWHPTGTHGTFAAAAAAGKILALNQQQMIHALGIAGSQAAGLMAAQYSSMVKRFHAGRAAQSGVYAALLAQRGFTGISNIFESDYGGYCTALAEN